jgi:hypothetical protein
MFLQKGGHLQKIINNLILASSRTVQIFNLMVMKMAADSLL